MVSQKIMQLREQIAELIMAVAGPNLHKPLTADTEILESKLIDSFGILQLIADIEQKLGINILTEDLTLENFSTIAAIVDLISCYQNKT
jgi:acyl carrier protein